MNSMPRLAVGEKYLRCQAQKMFFSPEVPMSCLRGAHRRAFERPMSSHKPSALLQKVRYICPSCACRVRPLRLQNQSRAITQNFLQKTIEAKLDWARQATEIKAGRKESMLTMLEKRGFVNQIIG